MELIVHGRTGILGAFSESAELADRLCEVLAHPERTPAMRASAREQAVQEQDLEAVTLPSYRACIERLHLA